MQIILVQCDIENCEQEERVCHPQLLPTIPSGWHMLTAHNSRGDEVGVYYVCPTHLALFQQDHTITPRGRNLRRP